MRTLIKSRLQRTWCLLTGAIVIASLIPRLSFHNPWLSGYISSDWVHFLAYAAAGSLPILAFRLRTGLTLSAGIALLSIALQLLRGHLSGLGTDFEGTVINLLGAAAGVLIGLHIHRFNAHTRTRLTRSNPAFTAGRAVTE